MNHKKSKQVYPNKGVWYIRYKDPTTKKWRAVSTKLSATQRNFKLALEYKDKLFKEIEKLSALEYRHGDVAYAFSHFKDVNVKRSAATKATYELFYSYLTQKIAPETPCVTINKKVAEDFLLWLGSLKTIQDNTKYGIQKNFLKFLKFLFEYEYIPKIFIINRDVKTQAKVSEPLVFSDEDRKKILEELSREEKNSNFRLMVHLLMYSGLRPSDIINVKKEDVDVEKMEMKFYSSKTGKWFVRPLHSSLKAILEERMKEVTSGRLFEYSEVKNMGKAFSRYLEVIGLSDKEYTLRTFRKDFISRSQEAGIPISVTASLVGHSNIKTTMTYYTKLSSKHLKDELSKLK